MCSTRSTPTSAPTFHRWRAAVGLGGTLGMLLGAPPTAHAQPFPRPGGAEIRIGAVVPEAAKIGFAAAGELDLGYLGTPRLRTLLGASYLRAAVERQVQGADVGGSWSAIGGQVGLRFDPLGPARIAPYGLVTVSGRRVQASDVGDRGTRALLEGFYVGGGVGGGLALGLDSARRTRVSLQAERVFVTNVSHWALTAGLRFTPRGGARTYARAPERRRDPAAEVRLEAERRLRDSERIAAAARQRDSLDVALAQSEAERARSETERLRTTQARAATAEAQSAAADGRAAEERARADSATAVSRREAEARTAAEAEAASERARADSLASTAREAERRAGEADARAFDALRNLRQVVASVTDVRETERGLTVVLGQGLFATGGAELSAAMTRQVATVAAVLAQYSERSIRVEGHTDATGSTVTNQRLSERRAESVRAALIANGVEPTRVESVGYGAGRPVADDGSVAGRAQNRRVEIVIVGAQRLGATTGQVPPGQ